MRTVLAMGCIGIGVCFFLGVRPADASESATDRASSTPSLSRAVIDTLDQDGSIPENVALAWRLGLDDQTEESASLGHNGSDGLSEQMPGANSSIFQRFSAGRDTSKIWQTMFEVPVGLYPQSDPGAHIIANEGINWVTSYQPLNRVYFGRSIGYARMEWAPGGQLDTIEVVQWDWTEILNIAVRPWWVVSFGVGVGFMDGLIFYKDGSFQHRLELYLPVQAGTGFRLGKSWFVSAKVLQSSYFGPGPVASAARSMIGLGYNY